MADIASLVKALKDKAVAQYDKGAPYRQALVSALRGDTQGINQALSKSDLTPMDFATTFAPMGMFIGKGSKVWNPNNEQLFLQLEQQGLSPKEIWQKTGTLRGADKMLRQETSDLGSKITDNVYEGIKANKRFKGPMSEAFTNPEFYNAYPEAKDVTTGMYAWHQPEGSYQAETNTITAGGPGTTSQKNTAIHELQHWVQNKEGFARGADISSEADLIHSGMLRNILEKNPGINYQDAIGMLPTRADIEKIARQNYHRSAGEVEAELARTRMNMTPEERLANYPYSGINMKKMIVRERE